MFGGEGLRLFLLLEFSVNFLFYKFEFFKYL